MNGTKLVVSFDPGVANMGVAGISVKNDKATLEFQRTFDIRDVKGELSADKLLESIDNVERLVGIMEKRHNMENETLWVVEYPPPLSTRANPGLVRQNTFVEAFIQCLIITEGVCLKMMVPEGVKKYFEFLNTNQIKIYQ